MTTYHWAFTKGGVGKTTHACNFAAWLTRSGRNVCLVDADGNLHANLWGFRRRNQPELARVEVEVVLCKSKMAEPLYALQKRYDDLVVDTGGWDSQELRSVMTVADATITPLKPKGIVLGSIERMQELLGHARGFNPRLKSLAYLSEAPTNFREARDITDSLDFARRSELTVLEEFLSLKKSWDTSWNLGRAVWEHPGTEKESAEFDALAASIQRAVNGQ